MSILTRGDLIDLIFSRVHRDQEFVRALLRDPRRVLSILLGLDVPDFIKVKLLQETADTIYLILPHVSREGDELSDADLECVGGGFVEPMEWWHATLSRPATVGTRIRERPRARTGPSAAEAKPDSGAPRRGRTKAPPGEPPAAAAPPRSERAERDPPRAAFALLTCPDAVVAREELELVVGLSRKRRPGVVGDKLRRPDSSVGPYTLTVSVVAPGFELRSGEKWRNRLSVTADAAYPTLALHLRAQRQTVNIVTRSIQAIFAVDGQTIGMAVRPVSVVKHASLLGEMAPSPEESPLDISIPTHEQAVDLTVHVNLDRSRPGTLVWTISSRFHAIRYPEKDDKAPPTTHVGTDPQAFSRGLMHGVNLREGQPGLYGYLKGIGNTIADKMPNELWKAFRAVTDRVNGPPTILLLSEEPHIPWELASVDGPLVDPQAPPFLGAQAHVGRWVLGSRRPRLPPPTELEVAALAVVAGVYSRPGWNRLLEAEDEAERLRQDHGATPVNAAAKELARCLAGNPEAEVLHFSMHGVYDPTGVQNGLVLVDGTCLDPMEVKGSELGRAPFVFLNACQVGQGSQVLGDYAGMAEAFLYAGASAVVAPLWSIRDSVAKEIALRFYQQAFAGKSPAQLLRTERATFSATPSASSTCLAYQFFGHPSLRLRRTHQEVHP